jgi:hypothetical protein
MNKRPCLVILSMLLVLLGGPPALAQTYQLTAYARAHAVDFIANTSDLGYSDFNFLNQPAASQLHVLNEAGLVKDGSASARFLGTIGMLKADAQASYAYCCSPSGQMVANGGSDGTVQASFYDTVAVRGAGLAIGTPVSYRLDLRIDGTLSSPSFEMGGFLTADGMADAALTDLSTNQRVSLRWDAKTSATGLYSLTLNTQVGHQLGISGSLFVQALISAYARSARDVSANFYQSAHYELAPDVAGLNTVGASGHEFLAAVPEPSTAVLWATALAAGWLWRRRARGVVSPLAAGCNRPSPGGRPAA